MLPYRQEVSRLKNKKPTNELNVKEYSIIQNFIFCIKNTVKCYPILLLWCLFAVLINTALPILTTFLPKVIIEEITYGASVERLVYTVLAFMLNIALLSGIKLFFEKYISFQKFRMNTYYIREVANKGMTTDYCNQEKEHFRKLQSESFNSCNGHYSPLAQIYDVSIALLSSSLGFLVYFGILAKLNIFVVLFLILTTLISYFLNKRIIKWASDNNKEKIGYGQKTNYINSVSSDLKSAKDIRLYNMAVWLEKVYTNNTTGLAGWYKRYTSKVFSVSIFDGGLALLREGVAYAYLLYLVLNSQISVADFVLYFGVITGFSVWLGGILGQINVLNRISLAFNYLRAYFEYHESYKRDSGIDTVDIMDFPKTIELKNVSYRYEGAETDTLKNISLKIDPAEHLAVVGLNGAGKTTLVKLICGLTDPTEGVVLYDGIDVKEYNRISYYRLYSAVFQQFSLMPVTVAEIIAEKLPEKIDYVKVKLCLKQAGLWDKIITLPNKLDSEFGKTIHDDGVEFSGGEIQKLLLARALYKSAPVLILDEPTAALDPISESRLYKSYNEITKNKSTVFISHRLASTRFCSRILLIENGRVAEEGTHDSLLLKKGRYYELFETQAKYYRENPLGEENPFDEEVDVWQRKCL
jgi:ATP-binding cassette subfamily B protein